MPRTSTSQLVVLLLVVGVLSAIIGAGTYALLGNDSSTSSSSLSRSQSQPVTRQTETSTGQIYDRHSNEVVKVEAAGSGRGAAQGSGFIYDQDGHVITNEHVIEGATSVTVTLSNGSSKDAKIVGSDASTDIAVLKISADNLNPITLSDSSKVRVGDPVVAIGTPLGLDNTITSGIVSALHRNITSPNGFTIRDAIQTDAAIDHGSSGGPLMDASGNVIGVTSQIESQTGGNDGFGFAVPSNTVRSVASQIISSGKADHAYMGVGIVTVTPTIAKQLKVVPGVELTNVRSDSPAAKAGLKGATSTKMIDGQPFPVGGDIIVAFDGNPTPTSDQLQSLIAGKKPGDTVKVTYVRDGKKHTVSVQLGTRPT